MRLVRARQQDGSILKVYTLYLIFGEFFGGGVGAHVRCPKVENLTIGLRSQDPAILFNGYKDLGD